MIQAPVRSQSCFCWLYRASPSLAAKYNSSVFIVNHLVMSMCRVFSCVVGRGCLLWPVCSLGRTLLAFSCFILYSKAKFACYSRCFSKTYFCIPVHHNEKGHLFWLLVLEGLVGLHRTIQLQLLQHYWPGQRPGLLWYWMVCLGNKQRSFCHFCDCIQ